MTTAPISERKTVSHYWKAATAFGGALVTFLVALQGFAAEVDVTPPAWVYGLGVAVSGVTAFVTWLKKNTLFAKQVDEWLAANGFQRVPNDETLPPSAP